MLFKVTYHPENKEMKDVNAINDIQSVVFPSDSASTCVDNQSSVMSNLLTVRNSSKGGSPCALDSEDIFMTYEMSESQHSKDISKDKLELFRQKRKEVEDNGTHFAAKNNERH